MSANSIALTENSVKAFGPFSKVVHTIIFHERN